MLDALSITEAEAAGLSELAALDLAMARDFAARAQAAEDPAVASDLARSYQRMARSYRQSLALKARLRMDTLHADRETPRRTGMPGAVPRPRPAHNIEDDFAIDLRAEELHGAVERVIWSERERAEAPETEADDLLDQRFERLEARLDQQIRCSLRQGAPQTTRIIAALRGEPGRPGRGHAARWRGCPEPRFGENLADAPGQARRRSGVTSLFPRLSRSSPRRPGSSRKAKCKAPPGLAWSARRNTSSAWNLAFAGKARSRGSREPLKKCVRRRAGNREKRFRPPLRVAGRPRTPRTAPRRPCRRRCTWRPRRSWRRGACLPAARGPRGARRSCRRGGRWRWSRR